MYSFETYQGQLLDMIELMQDSGNTNPQLNEAYVKISRANNVASLQNLSMLITECM